MPACGRRATMEIPNIDEMREVSIKTLPDRAHGRRPPRQHLLRDASTQIVLGLLRKHGPCSRADIVRYSGLSAPTVSTAVQQLQAMGLVDPMGVGLSNGGRPPHVIQYNSRFGYVIGMDIGTREVRTALADLEGKVIGECNLPTHSATDPHSISLLIKKCIRQLVGRAGISARKILRLGAAVPGITNVQGGVVLSAPILKSGWHKVPFAAMLSAETGIPVSVENDMNLSAVGESWRGSAQGVKDFVFVTVATGIGAGIFLDGKVYRGHDWAAGEIGYLQVPGTDEAPLAIYRAGSLETVIGAQAIEQTWRDRQKNCDEQGSSFQGRLSVTEIFDLAARGQTEAREIVRRTARILAHAISDVCVILNVALVVVGGRVASHPAVFEETCHTIQCNDLCRPRIALSSLGWRAPLLGAIRLALDHVEEHLLSFPITARQKPAEKSTLIGLKEKS
jgi:glucokinase